MLKVTIKAPTIKKLVRALRAHADTLSVISLDEEEGNNGTKHKVMVLGAARWTPEQVARLRELWGSMKELDISRELHRTPKGISIHARRIGLGTWNQAHEAQKRKVE